MDEITRTREEIAKTLNEIAAQVRDAMVEAHVAATLTASIIGLGLTPSSPETVVSAYREILAELQKDGPYKGVAG